MMKPTTGSGLTPLHLRARGDHWLAAPTSEPDKFAPFVLPRFPRSLLDWLVTGGDRVWYRRHRCLAALLPIDCRSGAWTLLLPRQRCGATAACWTMDGGERCYLSRDHRLGGTFQMLNPADDREIKEAVPA